MSLIYQSVAWILAALLMSIVIFFIVAFLINKKKNCIQMSCYDAPKKVSTLWGIVSEDFSFDRYDACQLYHWARKEHL